MPKERTQHPASAGTVLNPAMGGPKSFASIPAAELLNFLKETRRVQTWTERELAKALKVAVPQAKEAIAVLQLQEYIQRAGRTGKWRITEQGDLVSGAKPPRFSRQSVEDAPYPDRIKAVNDDADGAYRITDAVAYGDFLRDASRVQAADVGVQLREKRKDSQQRRPKSMQLN